MEVALLNYVQYGILALGMIGVVMSKKLKTKLIMLAIWFSAAFMYNQLHQSYAPKGVVKKAPHVVTQMTDGVMQDRLSKPMSSEQRDEIRRKSYEEIDAKVEHLRP